MNKDHSGPWRKALNWYKADYNIIRQEFGKVNVETAVMGKPHQMQESLKD